MLTDEEKEYLCLAYMINDNTVDIKTILNYFEDEPDKSAEIVNFWLTYDEFTQKIVHYLAIEKLRIKFESNYKKELPKWHRKTISYGLTRIISTVKKNLTSFGFQTSNEEKK